MNCEIFILFSVTFGTKYIWQTKHLQVCNDIISFLTKRKNCLFRYDTICTSDTNNSVSNFPKIHSQNYKISNIMLYKKYRRYGLLAHDALQIVV
jgi:hypothetical protein